MRSLLIVPFTLLLAAPVLAHPRAETHGGSRGAERARSNNDRSSMDRGGHGSTHEGSKSESSHPQPGAMRDGKADGR